MAKVQFVCTLCGAISPRWLGQCPTCQEWDVLVEQRESFTQKVAAKVKAPPTHSVQDLAAVQLERLPLGLPEVERVLGGGLVPGSLILLGGEPGIGKSTLTLQIAANLAGKRQKPVLLASGEESAEQIALRAQRLSQTQPLLHLLAENNLEEILAAAQVLRPQLLVVDSVQVLASLELASLPGSLPQIRLVTEKFLRFAKDSGVPVILIGHVTKDGDLAGPRVLSHLVDTVLTFEGDPQRDFRLLRATKNRFGSTNEVGVFEMLTAGLREVKNPSAAFLAGRAAQPLGSCVAVLCEGNRPLLAEVQALTIATNFGYPRRTASGFDLNRLQLLLAVLERHAGLKFGGSDVFLNCVGGLKLREPAADLAVCLALLSAKLNQALPQNLAAFGEVGLTGEVRAVTRSEQRLQEARKLGFTKVISPQSAKSLKEILARLVAKV